MSQTLTVEGIGAVEVAFTERGEGHPVVLLHGGAGPMSMVPWAELLARTRPVRAIIPTHPGFMGTPRPEGLKDAAGLARVYAQLFRTLKLGPATIVGNSIGGWIGAELGLLAPALVKNLVLVNAVGIDVPGHPVADVFSLPPDELGRLSYYNPQRFRIDPSTLTPEQKAAFAGNRAAIKLYGGSMTDVTLRGRLQSFSRPALAVWGEADRVVDPDYGRAFAEAIPHARFQLLAGSGHLPQLETPELLAETIWPFIAG